jgi:hypothetical protein
LGGVKQLKTTSRLKGFKYNFEYPWVVFNAPKPHGDIANGWLIVSSFMLAQPTGDPSIIQNTVIIADGEGNQSFIQR